MRTSFVTRLEAEQLGHDGFPFGKMAEHDTFGLKASLVESIGDYPVEQDTKFSRPVNQAEPNSKLSHLMEESNGFPNKYLVSASLSIL